MKRDFAGDVTSSRQRAFAASGGGRLLSTAVMQSVQSAMSPGQVAGANVHSGEKRRKSDTDRGSGNSDAPRLEMASVFLTILVDGFLLQMACMNTGD